MFVFECVTCPPAPAKSSTRTRMTYPFLCVRLKMSVHLLMSLDEIVNGFRLPAIKPRSLVIWDSHMNSNMRTPRIPSWANSFSAGGRNTYTRGQQFLFGPMSMARAVVDFPSPDGPMKAPDPCDDGYGCGVVGTHKLLLWVS